MLAMPDCTEDLLLWYLIEKAKWVPEQQGQDGSYSGKCLWHLENTGSMHYYPQAKPHIKCYGCELNLDLLQILGHEHFGIPFEEKITQDVFAKRDALILEFQAKGGVIQETSQGQVSTQSSRRIRLLSIPGPLQRQVLGRFTTWAHQQLLAKTPGAARVCAYLQSRGVSDQIIKQCPVLGYIPLAEDISWREDLAFSKPLKVSAEELAAERQWYQKKMPDENLSESLAYLRDSWSLWKRLGIYTDRGRWRLGGRLLFSSRTAGEEVRFYQGRILPWAAKGQRKFLNPPKIRKYPFVVSLRMCGIEEYPRMPGTLETESPFGPLVCISQRLCNMAYATEGESTPVWGYLQGLEEPHWLAHDNDPGTLKGKRLHIPGEKQAQTYAAFFDQHGVWHERLLPWAQYKGFDEWCCGAGVEPIVQTMQQILDQRDLPEEAEYGMMLKFS